MNELKMPPTVTKASKETIDFLKKVGILYEDETGLHVIERKGAMNE